MRILCLDTETKLADSRTFNTHKVIQSLFREQRRAFGKEKELLREVRLQSKVQNPLASAIE